MENVLHVIRTSLSPEMSILCCKVRMLSAWPSATEDHRRLHGERCCSLITVSGQSSCDVTRPHPGSFGFFSSINYHNTVGGKILVFLRAYKPQSILHTDFALYMNEVLNCKLMSLGLTPCCDELLRINAFSFILKICFSPYFIACNEVQ